ncbi:MAG: alpha-E domain-containing protein [Candidatus Dadabacteria bacterium]|nr:alpha-E domain-containing protein [Candidatus Dadabacteria bacterium]
MLSRVANSLYWMCRYIERAENIARFVDVNLNLLLDLPYEETEQWGPLVNTTGDNKLFEQRYGYPDKDKVINFLTFDTEYHNSIISNLEKARDNAKSVREIISTEMWEQINKYYYFVKDASGLLQKSDNLYDFYYRMKLESHLFTGVMDTTMSHGEGWHFGRMGRLLERADKTSRILDVKYYILLPSVDMIGGPIDYIQWAALLKSASALEMYRKRFRRILPEKVADFLIMDDEFPRAIRYCLIHSQRSLRTITGTASGTYKNDAERFLGKLSAELDYSHTDEIITEGLHEFLDKFQSDINLVGDSIHKTFFEVRT